MEEIKKILMSDYGFNKNLADIAVKAIQSAQVIPDTIQHVNELADQVGKLKALEAVLSGGVQKSKTQSNKPAPRPPFVPPTPLEKQIATGSAIDEVKASKKVKKEKVTRYEAPDTEQEEATSGPSDDTEKIDI